MIYDIYICIYTFSIMLNPYNMFRTGYVLAHMRLFVLLNHVQMPNQFSDKGHMWPALSNILPGFFSILGTEFESFPGLEKWFNFEHLISNHPVFRVRKHQLNPIETIQSNPHLMSILSRRPWPRLRRHPRFWKSVFLKDSVASHLFWHSNLVLSCTPEDSKVNRMVAIRYWGNNGKWCSYEMNWIDG